MATQIIKINKTSNTPMHCTYITTDAMTTAYVQVFYVMYFKLQAIQN